MISIVVERRYPKETYTIDIWYVNGVRICEGVEDTDRGLNQNMNEMAIKLIKIVGQTAIPTGTYRVVMSVSPKFKNKEWAKKYGGLVPEIRSVKGFTGVRVHPGSSAADSSGCLIPGDNKIKGGVINSRKRYFELMDNYLMPAWNKGEPIQITIKK